MTLLNRRMHKSSINRLIMSEGGPSSGKRLKPNPEESDVRMSDQLDIRVHQAFSIFQKRLQDVSSQKVYEVALSVGASDALVESGTITCWQIEKAGKGFSKNSNGRWQFDLTTKVNGKSLVSTEKDRWRPVVTAVPYYLSCAIDRDETTMEQKQWTSSHLCHHEWCVNLEHIVYETLDVNKSRNWCLGRNVCLHQPVCIRTGRRVQDLRKNTGVRPLDLLLEKLAGFEIEVEVPTAAVLRESVEREEA